MVFVISLLRSVQPPNHGAHPQRRERVLHGIWPNIWQPSPFCPATRFDEEDDKNKEDKEVAANKEEEGKDDGEEEEGDEEGMNADGTATIVLPGSTRSSWHENVSCNLPAPQTYATTTMPSSSTEAY